MKFALWSIIPDICLVINWYCGKQISEIFFFFHIWPRSRAAPAWKRCEKENIETGADSADILAVKTEEPVSDWNWMKICLFALQWPNKRYFDIFRGPSKIKYIWALIRLFDATTFSIFVSLFLFSSFVSFPCMFCHRFWTLSELLLSWVQFSWRSRKTGFSTAEFSAGEQFLSRRLSLEKVPEHHRHKVKDMTEICVKECRCLTTK